MQNVEWNEAYWQDGSDHVYDDRYEGWSFDDEADWQEVDRDLRGIAKRQSGIDADLMIALRDAERVRLWRHVGFSSMMEYLERVFGYAPRVAQERMRTARRLEHLPELAESLAKNEIPFSSVREVSRVATPKTVHIWRAAVIGKSLREVEEMVSGLREGDLPTDAKNPELQTVTLTFREVMPATRALARQVRDRIDAERGERLDDDAFLAAVFQLALGNATASSGNARAKYQIVQYHCDSCKRAKQLGGSVTVDISSADAERAQCDAERVSGEAPDRVTQDVPPKVRRFVELRDQMRCRAPGCRSTRGLELHHIVHREHGGTHDPSNLILLCEGHHAAHHRGALSIAGTAPDNLEVKRAVARVHMLDGTLKSAHVGAKFATAEKRAMALSAVTKLGWKPKIAAVAVDAALEELGEDASVEDVIRNALPRCLD